MFVYELGRCEFESRCSHLNFRYRVCFEQRVPLHSGNCRMYIHSKTRKSHDKNTQSYSEEVWSVNECIVVKKIYLKHENGKNQNFGQFLTNFIQWIAKKCSDGYEKHNNIRTLYDNGHYCIVFVRFGRLQKLDFFVTPF